MVAAPLRPVPGRKVAISILDLVQWAFQRELASLDFDEVGRETGATPGFGMEFVLIEQARLGCRVDGGGRSDPHPDADVVASALAALPEARGGRRMAVWIAELARAGAVPDWMGGAVPRLYPRATHINRHGESARTADAAELGSDGWPHWRRRNRRGVLVEEAVLYCPATWRPTAATIAAARRGYLAWWAALHELRANLAGTATLSAFEVDGRMPEMTPWAKKGLTKS